MRVASDVTAGSRIASLCREAWWAVVKLGVCIIWAHKDDVCDGVRSELLVLVTLFLFFCVVVLFVYLVLFYFVCLLCCLG